MGQRGPNDQLKACFWGGPKLSQKIGPFQKWANPQVKTHFQKLDFWAFQKRSGPLQSTSNVLTRTPIR